MFVAKSEVLFGKGEFSIREDNLPKLHKALEEYENTSGWQWCLQDSTGIKENGQTSKRYDEVLRSNEPRLASLQEKMKSAVANADKSAIHRTHPKRGESKPLTEAQVAAKETLIAAGFEEKVSEKMARVS